MPKTEFVLIPGAWHFGECYDDLVDALSKTGYTAHHITLPSVSTEPPPETFEPDVQAIREKVQSIIDKGNDVVVVAHSYGGIPSSEAMKYFAQNAGEGKGKVKRLVFMASFALQKGDTLHSRRNNKPADWWDVQGDRVFITIPNAKFKFFNDIPSDLATAHAKRLGYHSYGSFKSPLTYVPYNDIPTAYILCEKDQAIPINVQRAMIDHARDIAPNAMDTIESLDAGHSPFLNMPDAVAQILLNVA